MTDEAVAAYEELAQAEETGATEAPATSGEQFDYFLGDKSSKLPAEAEVELKHNGQMMRVPISQIINNYRLGAKFEDDRKAFKGEQEKFQAERGDYEGYVKEKAGLDQYKKLQDWSEAHPEQFQYLWNNLQKADNGLLSPETQETGVNTDALNKTIADLRQELAGVKEWKEGFEKKNEEAELQGIMKEIDEEAVGFEKEMQDKGFDIKLEEKDQEGISLKARILKFGADKGLDSFRLAALGVLEGTLLDQALAKGRNEAVKGIKGDASRGIIGRTSTPTTGQGTIDPRNLNEEQLKDHALAEYEKLAALDEQNL